MDIENFESIVKTALSNLYDFAALETDSDLMTLFRPPAEFRGTRGDYIRKIFSDTIEILKPHDGKEIITAPEWRVYLILRKRYVESINPQDIASQLAISERQLRRDLKKGVQALALLLWEQVQLSKPTLKPESDVQSAPAEFIINKEEITLQEIIRGVISLLSGRLDEEKIHIALAQSESSVTVESDRVILRQILISLVNELLSSPVHDLTFQAYYEFTQPVLQLTYCGPAEKMMVQDFLQDDQQNRINYWCTELAIAMECRYEAASGTGIIQLRFPYDQQKTILIVDDQEPALRMFTRYLSRTNFKIVGLNKPAKVLAKAQELQPALILLDIMMPKVDGWELFQSLRLDENTKHIPVIICSAWGEPELAKSLGANAFLRKPVTQRDLLKTIQSLGILDPGLSSDS